MHLYMCYLWVLVISRHMLLTFNANEYGHCPVLCAPRIYVIVRVKLPVFARVRYQRSRAMYRTLIYCPLFIIFTSYLIN